MSAVAIISTVTFQNPPAPSVYGRPATFMPKTPGTCMA